MFSWLSVCPALRLGADAVPAVDVYGDTLTSSFTSNHPACQVWNKFFTGI